MVAILVKCKILKHGIHSPSKINMYEARQLPHFNRLRRLWQGICARNLQFFLKGWLSQIHNLMVAGTIATYLQQIRQTLFYRYTCSCQEIREGNLHTRFIVSLSNVRSAALLVNSSQKALKNNQWPKEWKKIEENKRLSMIKHGNSCRK